MVFLEQSSNFSVFPEDSANINSFFPFLKTQFPISLGHCRQLFSSRTNLKLQECRLPLKDGEAVCGPFTHGLDSLSNMGKLSYGCLSGILEGRTD